MVRNAPRPFARANVSPRHPTAALPPSISARLVARNRVYVFALTLVLTLMLTTRTCTHGGPCATSSASDHWFLPLRLYTAPPSTFPRRPATNCAHFYGRVPRSELRNASLLFLRSSSSSLQTRADFLRSSTASDPGAPFVAAINRVLTGRESKRGSAVRRTKNATKTRKRKNKVVGTERDRDRWK